MELLNRPFVWQRDDWGAHFPRWVFQTDVLVEPATQVSYLLGKLEAALDAYGLLDAPTDAQPLPSAESGMLNEPTAVYGNNAGWQDRALTMAMEAVASYGIEGINLNLDALQASVAHSLASSYAGALPPPVQDYQAHVAHVMLHVTGVTAPDLLKQPLTSREVLRWHKALFPFGFSGYTQLEPGAYRTSADGVMQVVGGAIGHERVYYEAPPAQDVPAEMEVLMQWLGRTGTEPLAPWQALLQQALAHLWFVTIHPFIDGNGRLARLLSLHIMARHHGTVARWVSMAHAIKQDRNGYYHHLQLAQQRNLNHPAPDATAWINWYLNTLAKAVQQSLALVESKARSHKVLAAMQLHVNKQKQELDHRHTKLLNLLLSGQKETLKNKKAAAVLHLSQDTALRLLQDLVHLGLLEMQGGGRSTCYVLAPAFQAMFQAPVLAGVENTL